MAERTVVHDTIVTERTYDRPLNRVCATWREPGELAAGGAGGAEEVVMSKVVLDDPAIALRAQ